MVADVVYMDKATESRVVQEGESKRDHRTAATPNTGTQGSWRSRAHLCSHITDLKLGVKGIVGPSVGGRPTKACAGWNGRDALLGARPSREASA